MALFSYHQQSSEMIFSFVLFLVFRGVSGATFTFVNKCDYTVWPGILSLQGQEFGNTGFKLTNGSSSSFQAPTKWSGRFWARTDCKFDDSGKGTCATGDCGSGGVTCNGAGATVPVTLVEFTLGSGAGSQDFYDVSLVDGFNLPVIVEAKGGSGLCATTGCVADLNRQCPSELRTSSGDGCFSACATFNTSEYCCTGAHNTPSTCPPTQYSQMFKKACPKAYSYAYDDAIGSFTCSGANYTVTFCAASFPSSTGDSGAKPQIPVVKYQGATFTLVNKCDYPVWPGTMTREGPQLASTGFKLTNGSSYSFQAPANWTGRLWARTDCIFHDSEGVTCATGDCGSRGVACNGAGATPPATLAEFTLRPGSQDFYDVSLVDGFNLPIMVEANGGSGSCATTGCLTDLNRQCPPELRADGGNGCKSACGAFGKPEYCCNGSYSSSSACKPSNYSEMFKSACPRANSYAFDDPTSTFTCSGADYTVTFCAASLPGSTGDSGAKPQIPVVKHKVNRWWIWLIVGMGAPLALPPICYLCFALWRKYKAEVDRKMKQKNILHEIGGNAMLSMVYGKAKKSKKHGKSSNEVEIFSFESIVAATNNFLASNKLGEGGFGPVYKGTLTDGQEVAIKRLSKSSGQGLIEFKNEAKLMAKLQHTNLVRLLGFCIHRDERILVYEYMFNKSLDFYLFDASRRNALDWEKRLNIIEGIAQGLLYLHKYSRLKVIHRDLKAGNILLDEEMNPKISDFGLARIFGLKGSEENTNRIVGTYGYMSPEYAINGIVSIKTDVFSFGVLLLEILSGKKNNSRYDLERPLNLIGYAWQLWNEGRALELIDSEISESNTQNNVLRSIHIGLLCVQDQANDRPSMLDVVSFLSNDTIQLAQPKQPAFFISVIVEESELHNSRRKVARSLTLSWSRKVRNRYIEGICSTRISFLMTLSRTKECRALCVWSCCVTQDLLTSCKCFEYHS